MLFTSGENSIRLDGIVCETDHALVCRARLANQKPALVKFLPKVDFFFEELSRHYACDHSPYLPKLLHNFPPTSVGGLDYLSASEIEQYIQQSWPGVDLAEIGALVIEFVAGTPIANKLKNVSNEEQVLILLQIAEALRDLHSQGEYHGQLTPDQIVFDALSQQVRFIDLSYFQGKIPSVLPQLSPEHNPHSKYEVGPQSDIYMFALHFLAQLEKPSHKLQRVIQLALDFDPMRRPLIDTVLEQLSAETNRVSTQKSRRRRIWSPVWISILACYGFFSTIAITHYYDNPLLRARTQILEQSNTNTRQAVIALAEVRADANTDDNTAAILARDIAQLKREASDFQVFPLTRNQIENPVAIFALDKLPSMVTWNHVFTIGDWVQFNNQTGYVSRIDSFSMKLTFNTKTEEIFFSDPGFRFGLADSRVVIWKRQGNLETVLKAIDNLADLYQVTLDYGHHHRILNAIVEGNFADSNQPDLLFGTFEVSTFSDFLFKLETIFNLQVQNSEIQLANKQAYPLHYIIHFFHFGTEVPISQAYRYVESSIGIPIVMPDALEDRTIGPLEAFQVSWDEALDLLGYRWEIRNRGRSSEIVIFDQPIHHQKPANIQLSDL